MNVRVALLLLAACASDPPRGPCGAPEKCSPLAPHGLDFATPEIHRQLAYVPELATGGTMHIGLYVTLDDVDMKPDPPLAVPYKATISDPAITIDQQDNVLTLHAGAGAGSATLDIRDADGLLLGRDELGVAPIAKAFIPIPQYWLHSEGYNSFESDPVFAPGASLNLGLEDGSGADVVDDAMQIAGATQTAWDLFDAPTTGTVTVKAGDHAPIDVAVPTATNVTVSHIGVDASASVAQPAFTCFEARSDGHQVYGAMWTITVTPVGGTGVYGDPTDAPNCIDVGVLPMATATAAMVTVMVLGASQTITLPVI